MSMGKFVTAPVEMEKYRVSSSAATIRPKRKSEIVRSGVYVSFTILS